MHEPLRMWVSLCGSHAQSLMKLANKRGAEVGPEIVDEVEREAINVVSNTQLKVGFKGI